MKKVLIIAALAGFYACGAPKTTVTVGQSQIDKVKHLYPDYTLADFNSGKTAYETSCKSCHPLKDPGSKTEQEWKVIVPKMVEKANKKTENISPATKESIERYLVTSSKTYK